MFAGFNLTISQQELNQEYYYRGLANNVLCKIDIQETLNKFLDSNGEISATALESDWFPSCHANIFISHSHIDQDIAIKLSGFLDKEYGLKCFIDSCVWKYVNDLLKIIDDKYCRKDDGNYDYDARNISTSHAHMILNGALIKMINKTECLFFLNTPNSVKMCDIKAKISSPWIYSELLVATEFPHQPLSNYRGIKHSQLLYEVANKIPINYDISIDRLEPLLLNEIVEAGKQNKGINLLDRLYYNKGLFTKAGD